MELELITLIAHALHEGPLHACTLHDEFGHLTIQELLKIVDRTGRKCAKSTFDHMEIFRQAANVFSDWPKRWHALIERDYNLSSARNISLALRYPIVNSIVSLGVCARRSTRRAEQIMLQAFLNHVCSMDGNAGIVHGGFARGDATRKMITIAEAANILKTTRKAVERMILIGVFTSIELKTRSERVINYLYRYEIEEYAANLSESHMIDK